MLQIEQAFLTQGYGALTMRAIAKSCDFSTRALYFYFSSKEETFRAVVRFRNELALKTGFEAGRKRREAGADALDILSDVINIRYGDTRRMANASPHLIGLNAQVFTFCTDVYADGRLIGQTLANRYREDLAQAGLGSGRHAFVFTPPDGMVIRATVAEVRRSLDGAHCRGQPSRNPLRRQHAQGPSASTGGRPPGGRANRARKFCAKGTPVASGGRRYRQLEPKNTSAKAGSSPFFTRILPKI